MKVVHKTLRNETWVEDAREHELNGELDLAKTFTRKRSFFASVRIITHRQSILFQLLTDDRLLNVYISEILFPLSQIK